MLNCIIYMWFDATEGGDPGTVVKADHGFEPHSGLQENKTFLSPSLVKIQYCGEPPCAHIG